MGELLVARAAIAMLPLSAWSGHFALAGSSSTSQVELALRLAAHIRRAAQKLPFESKCLPQALALSRMLRRRRVPHRLIIAARPKRARSGSDDLHAWIETDDTIVLGDLPGPWLPVMALPEPKPGACISKKYHR